MALTAEQRKWNEELFRFFLEKKGMTYAEFRREVKQDYVVCSLDLLTKEERRKFKVSLKTKAIPMQTKEEKERLDELFKLILSRYSSASRRDFWFWEKHNFMAANRDILDTLTDKECKKFHLNRIPYIRTYDKNELSESEYTKDEQIEISRQTKILLELLLTKTGTKREDIIEKAYLDFIYCNKDLLKKSEMKKFDKLLCYNYIQDVE
ncbi:MAG: hypothetical protein J6T63_01650 [Bacteroidales bacterium]|nr:hypothetical protein [Bacteroidales bacterium]